MTRTLTLAFAAAGLLFTACERAAPPAAPSPAPVPPAPETEPAPPDPPAAPPDSPAAGPESETAPGVAVGEQAPAFAHQDQSGQERTLAGLLEQGNVALVFYRSADW